MRKTTHHWRMLALAALALLSSGSAFAGSTKYYKTDVSIATGEGKVYASVDYVQPSRTSFGETSSTKTVEDSVSYVFAQPAAGYAFVRWNLTSGSLTSTSSDLSSNPVMLINAGNSTSQSSPATLNLTAVFEKAAVSVSSEDNVLGTVSISNVANSVGQTVTLYAYPSKNIFKGSNFQGWYRKGKLVSRNSTFPLAISNDNAGEYVAKFKRTAGYFRVKNAYSGRYAYMIGDSAHATSRDVEGFNGVKFDGSIAMKDASELSDTDLNYIVKIDGVSDGLTGGLKDLDVTCQGVSTRSILQSIYPNAMINTETKDGIWKFVYNNNLRDIYLKDGIGFAYPYAIACAGDDNTDPWNLEPVNNIPVKFTIIDGQDSVATTLYTTFAYTCPKGVKAYYINKDSSLVEISRNEVPKNTPVILKCKANGSNNYSISPSFESFTPITDNILEGYIKVNGKKISTDSVKVYEGNGKWKAVLSAGIGNNSAYLPISQTSEFNAKANSTTSISQVTISRKASKGIYDINGRKIGTDAKNLKQGIYIINGRKVIVK